MLVYFSSADDADNMDSQWGLYSCQHVVQLDSLYTGEVRLLQDVVVVVFGHDELGIACHGAIHKLVVVGVGRYQVEAVVGCDKKGVRIVHYHIDGEHGKRRAGLPFQNFFVFLQYLVGDAEPVAPVEQREPDGVVTAPAGETLNKAVRVEY